MTIAKESGHWYTKEGIPAYEVEYADKKRKGEFRPTTIKDARKLNLAPSVTTINKQIANFGIQNYRENQLIESAYTCPLKRSDVDSDTWITKVKEDAQEHAKVAREKGVYKHAELEKFLKGGYYDPAMEVQCLAVLDILKSYGIELMDVQPEKSFAHSTVDGYWYGGKADCPAPDKNFNADFKTTDFTLVDGKPFKKGKIVKLHYDEHLVQNVSYADGIIIAHFDKWTLLNIYLSTIDDSVYVHEWDNELFAHKLVEFQVLTELWYMRNW